jgi:hypothetical protein
MTAEELKENAPWFSRSTVIDRRYKKPVILSLSKDQFA